MFCNNCCLCLPMRGGGLWLAGLCLLINAIGAIFFFVWGTNFFSSTLSVFFGGFSGLQAVMAGLALVAFCNFSYMLTRLFVYVQWLVTFLSVARIGIIAFELEQNRDQITGECNGELNYGGTSIQGTTAAFYCNTPINSFILIFIAGLAADWVLNGYLYFVVWRFYVRMRLYPELMKAEEFTYEEGLDEL